MSDDIPGPPPAPRVSPLARVVIAFVGVIVGAALIFAGIGSFREDPPAQDQLIVPAPTSPGPSAPATQGSN